MTSDRDRHQRAVVEAALEVLGNLKDLDTKIVDEPDKRIRDQKAVDYVAQIGEDDYEIEHTQVQSFAEQIADDHRFGRVMGSVEERVRRTLDTPGFFRLAVDPHAVAGVKDENEAAAKVSCWVLERAPVMAEAEEGVSANAEIGKPPELPFEVTLTKHEHQEPAFFVCRFKPEDLEEQRRSQVTKALSHVVEKVDTDPSHRTLLVLESNDVALANSCVIGEALWI